MSFLATNGKGLVSASVTLTNGAPNSAAAIAAVAGAFTDIYTVVITTNETAVRTVTLTDGVTSISYYVGGSAAGVNVPVFDQGSVPLRFKPNTAVQVNATTVTAATQIYVNIRGVRSNT